MPKLVTPPEAKKILDQNTKGIYLDVRSEPEFAGGHAAGAINVPLMHKGAMGMQPNADFLAVAEKVLDRNQTVLCGCQSGGRSQRAAEMLEQAGFKDVYNIVGGWGGGMAADGSRVPGWREAGLPTSNDVDAQASYAGQRKKAGL